MTQLGTVDWDSTFQDARSLLDRLSKILYRPTIPSTGVASFPSAFEHVLGTRLSVREYWFQLQLHYALSEAFAAETEWHVLESEPPGVRLSGKLADKVDARGKPVLKYPDMLVVRGPDDPTFIWFELKWVDSERKMGRFFVDALLLGKSSNIPDGKGQLAASLKNHMRWKELPQHAVGRHIGVGLAACPVEQIGGQQGVVRMENLEQLLESFNSGKSGWRLTMSDLPPDFGAHLLQEKGWTKTTLPTFNSLLSQPPFRGNVCAAQVQVGQRSLGLVCWLCPLPPPTESVG